MIVGIILAAGKGTRLNPPAGGKDKNKVTLSFLNKPLIIYAVELLENLADKVIVVVGAFHKSVRHVLQKYRVEYAYQVKRLGTGHAVKVALKKIIKSEKPELILICYGDHSMFYKKTVIKNLIEEHKKVKAVLTFVTTHYERPNDLVWGRVIRDFNGSIIKIVEQKDATDEEKKVKEVNAGFYCFDYLFLKENMNKLKRSPVSREYYITDMIKIALDQKKKVIGHEVPFNKVGIGINRYEELAESQKIYLSRALH